MLEYPWQVGDTFTRVLEAGRDGVPTVPVWEQLNAIGQKWGFGGTQDHVRSVVYASGYPEDRFVFVEGMVEDTLPAIRPEKISTLRVACRKYRSRRRQ